MTQKQLFNSIPGFGPPTFPVEGQTAALFHKLVAADDSALWALHLWMATNNTVNVDDDAGLITVLSTPPGGDPLVNPTLITSRSYLYDAAGAAPGGDPDAGDQQAILHVCDGVPLRGPLDLHILNSSVAGIGPVVFFGYIVRGESESKQERRFFDPGGNIGDQVTDFTGGQAVTVAGAASDTPIHTSGDEYIDEVTLDVRGIQNGAGDDSVVLAGFGWDGAGAAGALIVRFGRKPVRLFDGLPVRGGGTLAASGTGGQSAIYNGYFVRG